MMSMPTIMALEMKMLSRAHAKANGDEEDQEEERQQQEAEEEMEKSEGRMRRRKGSSPPSGPEYGQFPVKGRLRVPWPLLKTIPQNEP